MPEKLPSQTITCTPERRTGAWMCDMSSFFNTQTLHPIVDRAIMTIDDNGDSFTFQPKYDRSVCEEGQCKVFAHDDPLEQAVTCNDAHGCTTRLQGVDVQVTNIPVSLRCTREERVGDMTCRLYGANGNFRKYNLTRDAGNRVRLEMQPPVASGDTQPPPISTADIVIEYQTIPIADNAPIDEVGTPLSGSDEQRAEMKGYVQSVLSEQLAQEARRDTRPNPLRGQRRAGQ